MWRVSSTILIMRYEAHEANTEEKNSKGEENGYHVDMNPHVEERCTHQPHARPISRPPLYRSLFNVSIQRALPGSTKVSSIQSKKSNEYVAA